MRVGETKRHAFAHPRWLGSIGARPARVRRGGNGPGLAGGGRGEGRAAHTRLHVGDDVPFERDLDLVLLHGPATDRREPPEAALALGHDPAPAVDDRAPIRRGELLVLFGGATALGPALQSVGVSAYYYLLNAAPYVLTLSLLIWSSSPRHTLVGAPSELSISR